MLKVNNISFGYGKDHLNLDDVSFSCKRGQLTAVLGNNGCGKTTLIKVIDRILIPEKGSVVLDNVDLSSVTRKQMSQKIAYVCQENRAGDATVFDSILLGRKPYINYKATDKDYEITENVINMLNLQEYSLRQTNCLSGGEYQKVVLGRALAQEPSLLLLDEPTSNLDMKNQKEVLELVGSIVKEMGIMALVVIHDINSALRYCNNFVFIKNHKVYASGGREICTSEIISEVYGLDVTVHEIDGKQIVMYN